MLYLDDHIDELVDAGLLPADDVDFPSWVTDDPAAFAAAWNRDGGLVLVGQDGEDAFWVRACSATGAVHASLRGDS